ncbi:hypothetical protein [Kitasatospora cineracea]|uniref:Helix-turn-helix protein n=1 Tax=Kitasatospora cineracea TaxID=88074 RepID=A0A8G1UF84_9ACTN|nr:hypothetical protein [Kitasatospora cineracea]ROR42853.1 hypothetical protein EDD39_0984 [Kitasatospora cineracea]
MCSVTTTVTTPPRRDTAVSVRLAWRNGLRNRWVKQIPRASRGQSQWRSLSGDFTGFLLYLGDMADEDGTNLRTPPSRDTVAAFVRCSKETVQRYYEAAEAAGLVFLRRDQGGRIAGYRLLMPFGDLPDWRGCLDALRSDARRVKQQEKREHERVQGWARGRVRTCSSSRADECGQVHSSAPADELTPPEDTDSSARDDVTGPHVTSGSSARADTTRLTRLDTGMAEVVGAVTTPRARAPYDGRPPTRPEHPPRPRHPVVIPRPRAAVEQHPATKRFTSDGHPVVRPGTSEWNELRANLRAANPRRSELLVPFRTSRPVAPGAPPWA